MHGNARRCGKEAGYFATTHPQRLFRRQHPFCDIFRGPAAAQGFVQLDRIREDLLVGAQQPLLGGQQRAIRIEHLQLGHQSFPQLGILHVPDHFQVCDLILQQNLLLFLRYCSSAIFISTVVFSILR